jgi:predicted Zn-ribbon and HTH transcriptional regulator
MSKPDRMTLEQVITAAEGCGGILIVETWTCRKCGCCAYEIHKFNEVNTCPKCQHRRASEVELYRWSMNKAADDK